MSASFPILVAGLAKRLLTVEDGIIRLDGIIWMAGVVLVVGSVMHCIHLDLLDVLIWDNFVDSLFHTISFRFVSIKVWVTILDLCDLFFGVIELFGVSFIKQPWQDCFSATLERVSEADIVPNHNDDWNSD